jgi:hypothetical protein
MHRYHMRVAAPEQRTRPAKVISIEARRQARRIEQAKQAQPKPAA